MGKKGNTVHRPSQSNMEWINVRNRKTGEVTRCKNTAYVKRTGKRAGAKKATEADFNTIPASHITSKRGQIRSVGRVTRE